MLEELQANNSQLSDSLKKRKVEMIKRQREAAAHSPCSSDCSSAFFGSVKDLASVDDRARQKKFKKEKITRAISDSQLEESSTMTSEADTGISGRKKKKKRKVRPSMQTDGDDLCVPVDQGNTEDSEAYRKKRKKKKAVRERPDSQLESSFATSECEVKNEAGAGISRRKKKKKRKVRPGLQADGDVAMNQDDSGNADQVYEGTPTKKKKKEAAAVRAWFTKQDEASKLISGCAGFRTDSTSSGEEDQADPSGTAGAKEELSASPPQSASKKQRSSHLSQKKRKGATKPGGALAEPGSPIVERELCEDEKPSDTEVSDVDVPTGEAGTSTRDGDRGPGRSLLKQLISEVRSGRSRSSTPIRQDAEEWASAGHPASPTFSFLDNEFVESSGLATQDLDTAIQELEEFIPHVRSLSASAVKQLATRDLIRFKNFKREGVAVKFGKFSKKENNQLKKNVEAFLKASGIDTAEKLLFAHRFPEEKAAINKLKSKHLFGVRIAEGIPRPWRLVYYRARKIFDPQNYSGWYSEKDKQKLKKYHTLYGNNWKKIGDLMTRSSRSVAMKYSQIKSNPNFGPWSKEETKKLIQAVGEMVKSNTKGLRSALKEGGASEEAVSVAREKLYRGISWVQVEAKVGTRNWRQCKQKWMAIVTKKLSQGPPGRDRPGNLQARINLIERMYELNITDANEIDWENLSSAIGNVPPDYVQIRFYKLKAKHVPDWNRKDFSEIIDHLYEVTLPKLKKLQMKKRKGAPDSSAAEPGPTSNGDFKRVFRFSDIFQWSDDSISSEESENELESRTRPDSRS